MATRERTTSNACHAVGDNGVLTASYKFVSRSFDDCITIIARVVFWISALNDDGGKAGATRVFANRFISEIYFLNGRKVMT